MHASRLLTVDCGAAHVAVARFAHGSDCALTLEGFSAQPLATAGAGEEAWLAEVGAALRLVGRREGWRGACLLGLPGHLTLSRIVGLPDSPIINITLRNVQITAETDFVIKDAGEPVFENVTRNIKKGVAPARPAMRE